MDEQFIGLTEKTIKCPHCNNMTALEETDPNTNITSWLCVECGYTSNSMYRKNTKELRQLLHNSPQLIVDSKIYDKEHNVYWMLTVISMPNKGMLFPIGDDPNNVIWNYAYIENIPEEEQRHYPIPGKEGKFFTQRLSHNPLQFTKFYDALKNGCNRINT